MGYCLCTDLHWRVRAALGQPVTERTYIQFLVARLTGWTPSVELASNAALVVFLAALALNLTLQIRDRATIHASCRASEKMPAL